MEEWKDIPGYESRYQISSLGRIKKLGTGIIMRQHINNGYLKCRLRSRNMRGSFWVHRIVAMAFLPNALECAYVNHKDRDRLNNTLENLEWVTPKENTAHWMSQPF